MLCKYQGISRGDRQCPAYKNDKIKPAPLSLQGGVNNVNTIRRAELINMAKTWFLFPGPDFTFKPDGLLRLGTVIEHPKDPTKILLQAASCQGLKLPGVTTITETNHTHSRTLDRSFAANIFAKIFSNASVSFGMDAETDHSLSFGTVDHEVQQFDDVLSEACLRRLVSESSARSHMDSGIFGKRPLYIVTGLRVTRQPMSISKTASASKAGAATLSGNATGGSAPLEIGGDIRGTAGRAIVDSYEAPAGVIFAYRVHIIREKSDRATDGGIFSSRAAFMGSTFEEIETEFEAVEGSPQALEDDIEENANFDSYPMDVEDYCVVFP